MDPALERYLTRATRGVWGKKRLEVIAELRGNIQVLVAELQLAGMNHDQALECALQEFGDPRRLARQFTEVHTMPSVQKIGILASGLVALTIAAVTSAAPIAVSTIAPLPDCATVNSDAVVNAAFNCAYGGPWLEVGALRDELTRNGGALEVNGQRLNLRFAGDANAITLSLENPAPLTINPGGMPEYTYHQFRSFERDAQTFVSVQLFVREVATQSKLPVQLEGWQNPTLRVGETRLELGSAGAPLEAHDLYNIGLFNVLRAALPSASDLQVYDSSPGKTASFLYELHRIALGAGVYAVLSQDAKGKLVYTIAPSINGVLEVFLPAKRAQFVRDLGAVQTSGAEVRAAMLKLTGALNGAAYAVVLPQVPSSQAVAR